MSTKRLTESSNTEHAKTMTEEKQVEVVEGGAKGKKRRGGSKKGQVKQAIKPAQLSKALHLAALDRPVREIARAIHCPESTTRRLLDRYGAWLQELEHVQEYTDTRQQLLTAGELKLLKNMMTQDKLDKASVNNLAYSMRQLYDMGRLEKGLSTTNVAQQVVKVAFSPKGFSEE